MHGIKLLVSLTYLRLISEVLVVRPVRFKMAGFRLCLPTLPAFFAGRVLVLSHPNNSESK